MEYPRLPPELDRRRVLTETEKMQMIELRNSGLSSRALAATYGVSKSIVLYWTNGADYRVRKNKERYSLIKQKEKQSPAYKEKRKEESREWKKEIINRYEPKKRYKHKQTYKSKKKRLQSDPEYRKKINEESLKRYHKKRKIN